MDKRHITNVVGSIPAGGPIVDEFFSTVPGWFFDMCTILLEPKTIYPSEFTLSRVKCHKILINITNVHILPGMCITTLLE